MQLFAYIFRLINKETTKNSFERESEERVKKCTWMKKERELFIYLLYFIYTLKRQDKTKEIHIYIYIQSVYIIY